MTGIFREETKTMQSEDELRETIYQTIWNADLGNCSLLSGDAAKVTDAVMPLVAAHTAKAVAAAHKAARLDEVTYWHKRTLKEAPHPSDISSTLHAQERRNGYNQHDSTK